MKFILKYQNIAAEHEKLLKSHKHCEKFKNCAIIPRKFY